MWVVIFSDVRELSSAPRGGGWRKKVSWSLLSIPQCTSSVSYTHLLLSFALALTASLSTLAPTGAV